MNSLIELVSSQFNLPVNCYRHCSNQARLVILSASEQPTGCIVCPSGYVSRIVLYFEGGKADIKPMKDLLSNYADKLGGIRDSDIRIASRHPWDLHVDSNAETLLQEVYWTQNYKREESSSLPLLKLQLPFCSAHQFIFKPLRKMQRTIRCCNSL